MGGIIVVGFLCFGNLSDDDYDVNISFETMQTKPDYIVDASSNASSNASSGANSNASLDANVPAMNMNPQESSFSTPTIGGNEFGTGNGNDLENDTDNDNGTDDNNDNGSGSGNGSGNENDDGNNDNDNDNGAGQDVTGTGTMDENGENDGTANDANDEDTENDLIGNNDADLAADGVGTNANADADGTNINIDTNDEAADADAETEAASNEGDTDTSTTNDTADVDVDADADIKDAGDVDTADDTNNVERDAETTNNTADADADADADGTPEEEVVADPHLYIKEEKVETAVEENKSEDAKAVNHMDGEYYEKMKKFQASAGIAVNDTMASGDVHVETDVAIGNSSATGNDADTLVVVDEATLGNSTVVGSRVNTNTTTTNSIVETVVASENETATGAGAGKANVTNVLDASIANASVSVSSTNASVATATTPTHVITSNDTDVGASGTKVQASDGAPLNVNSTVLPDNHHDSGAVNHTVNSGVSVKANATAVKANADDADLVVENKAIITTSELNVNVNLTDADGNNDHVVNNTDTAVIKVDDVTTNATTATQKTDSGETAEIRGTKSASETLLKSTKAGEVESKNKTLTTASVAEDYLYPRTKEESDDDTTDAYLTTTDIDTTSISGKTAEAVASTADDEGNGGDGGDLADNIEEVKETPIDGVTSTDKKVADDSESKTIAVALELCKTNPFAHTLELSLEDIQVEAEKILNEKKKEKIEEVTEGVVREEEAEGKQSSATRHLRGLRSRGLEQVSSGAEVAANVSTQDTNTTLPTVFSVKCKDDESSIIIPGMCGGLVDKDFSKHSDCEYYVAYAGALPDDLASMPIHIRLAQFSNCKVNVVSLCGGDVDVKLSTATLVGDRDLDDSIKERIVVHEDTCIESGKSDIDDLGVEVSTGIVAKPTPSDTNLLYIDLTGSSTSPSDFLGYISGERLRLVNTSDDLSEKGEVYLPKQIVFNGISETFLEEPLQMSLLSKGYAILRGVGPLSLIRFLCPKTKSMGGSASFVAAGFPM